MSTYNDLKGLPESMGEMLNREIGGNPVPAELFAVIRQLWPPTYEGVDGRTIIEDAEAIPRLEAMFELYGVPLKVAGNSVTVLGHAYDVFVALSTHVLRQLRKPSSFRKINSDWPEEWLCYVEAVAAQDKAEARRLAQKLQPLAPGAELPPRVYMNPPVISVEQGSGKGG